MKHTPIACCAFCGDDATQRAEDGTAVCENCFWMYKPKKLLLGKSRGTGGVA